MPKDIPSSCAFLKAFLQNKKCVLRKDYREQYKKKRVRKWFRVLLQPVTDFFLLFARPKLHSPTETASFLVIFIQR